MAQVKHCKHEHDQELRQREAETEHQSVNRMKNSDNARLKPNNRNEKQQAKAHVTPSRNKSFQHPFGSVRDRFWFAIDMKRIGTVHPRTERYSVSNVLNVSHPPTVRLNARLLHHKWVCVSSQTAASVTWQFQQERRDK